MEESEAYLARLTNGALQDGTFSSEDLTLIQRRLWLLLGQRTQRYTMGDSTSVPIETAQELLKSICFSIGLYLKTSGKPDMLKTDTMQALLDAGRGVIQQQVEAGKLLLEQALRSAPDIDNVSYRDTLDEIGSFFKHYDPLFFAHEVPCSIDYQLCIPVSEQLQGIEYICQYLQHLVLENAFCHHFDSQRMILLLQSYCPDYRELLINLYEPVAVNAVGCALLQQDITGLDLTAAEQEELLFRFQGCTAEDILLQLTQGCGALSCALGITENAEQQYLLDAMLQLAPRIETASKSGSLSGIFLSLHCPAEPSGSVSQFIDGPMLCDEALRALIQEISDCRFLSDKIAMVKRHIHSLFDLAEVLNTCFWGDDSLALFSALGGTERALLRHYLQQRPDGWVSDSGWEAQLLSFPSDP